MHSDVHKARVFKNGDNLWGKRVYTPREYSKNDLRNKSGIYQIRNLINNKIYIGSSKNLLDRFKEHSKRLKSKRHVNIKLQNAFNKYGQQNFIFEVIEFVSLEDLISIEQYWINTLDAVNIGYNINPTAGLPPSRKHTEKEIELLRNSPLCKKVICVEQNTIYKSLREAGRLNNIPSPNIRDCVKYKYRTAKGLHFLYYEDYKKLNKEELEITLRKPTAIAYNKRAILCLTNNKTYSSIKEAGEDLNINSRCIQKCCAKILKTYKGYQFKYIN